MHKKVVVNDEIGLSIGDYIKTNRSKMGLSTLELSVALGFSQSYIGMIESGIRVPRLRTLVKIVNFFRVPFNFDSLCDNTIRIKESHSETAKKNIQNELLHLYCNLDNRGKQIVLSTAEKMSKRSCMDDCSNETDLFFSYLLKTDIKFQVALLVTAKALLSVE